MKKVTAIVLVCFAIFGTTIFVLAAPVAPLYRSIVPEIDNTYYIGTTTPSNLRYNGVFNNLVVSGTCTGCGGIATPVSMANGGTGNNSFPSSTVVISNGTVLYGYATSSLGIASSGITAIGPTGQIQTGPTQILATTTSTTNGFTSAINIIGSGNTQTFLPSLSGTLSVLGGGTGITSATQFGVMEGNGTGPFGFTSAPTNGAVLRGNSLGIPVFGTININSGSLSILGTLPISFGGTGWSTSSVGDLLVGTTSASQYSRLPLGTYGSVLQATSSTPYGMAWVATSTLGISGGSGASSVGSAGYMQFASSTPGAFDASSTLFWNNSTGRLAVGTTTAPITSLGLGKGMSLPFTTDANTGVIYQGDATIGYYSFIHDYPGFNTSLNYVPNMFIGFQAGNFGLTGVEDFGIGSRALAQLSTGSGNFMIGSQNGFDISTGNNNVGVGPGVLGGGNFSGNTGIGNQALHYNVSGDNNTAVGISALINDNSGQSNVAIGAAALVSNTVGNFNVGIGNNGGNGIGGSNNVAIGWDSGDAGGNGSYNIQIGSQAEVPDPNGIEQLDIGNLIYGIGLDGYDFNLASGSIGISTTSPFAKLSVQTNSTNLYGFAVATATARTLFAIDPIGNQLTDGDTPTLSSCGTSPSIVGDNTQGIITTGSGISVTACTLTFADGGYPGGTDAVCTISTNSLVAIGDVSSLSNTSATFGLSASLASGIIYYKCGATQ